MAQIAKLIKFDPQGESLWIHVEMFGIYFTTYVYQLWSATPQEPPILTNPLKSGSNEIPHDDFFPVTNDYNPTDPIANYNNRIIDVRFWVKKGEDDNGYKLRVSVLQGNQFDTAQTLGFDEVSGTNGALSIRQEFITIVLAN